MHIREPGSKKSSVPKRSAFCALSFVRHVDCTRQTHDAIDIVTIVAPEQQLQLLVVPLRVLGPS